MITKEKLRIFVAGIIATVGTWMIAFPMMDYLQNNAPVHNPYIVGFTLIVISWYIAKN